MKIYLILIIGENTQLRMCFFVDFNLSFWILMTAFSIKFNLFLLHYAYSLPKMEKLKQKQIKKHEDKNEKLYRTHRPCLRIRA